MSDGVDDLIEFLLPEERDELDEHLAALDAVPFPDVAYQNHPVGWMRDVLEIPEEHVRWSLLPEYKDHEWDGTRDPLARICEAIAGGLDVGVESGAGTGKTYLAGALALWFHACFEDSLVVTTAPKEGQLTTQLWKEIGRHWPKFSKRYPMAKKVTLRVRMKEGAGEQETWAILGYACGVGSVEESATKAQGFHAPHMLIITEETPGVDPAVMTAFKNTCTGDHNIRLGLGNPDHRRDSLHQMCAEPGVIGIRISALDHPNVVCGRDIIPGAVGRKSIANKLDQYKAIDHPMYQSRVRGICPSSGTVPFPREMVEKCNAPLSAEPPAAWGWDVARAQDETVGIPLDVYGAITKEWVRWSMKGWPEQVRHIVPLMRSTVNGTQALVPGVMDSTGVGDAVLEMAQSMGAYTLSAFVFTDRSRQELLERLQGALLNGTIRGPFAEGGELAWITAQLESFEYEYTTHGVRWRAPDGAGTDDGAFALALAVYCYDRAVPPAASRAVPQKPAEGQDPHRWQDYVGMPLIPGVPPLTRWQGHVQREEEPAGDGWDSQLPRGW